MVRTETRAGADRPYVVFGPYSNSVASLDRTQSLLNNLANPDSSRAVDLEGMLLFDKFLKGESSQAILQAIKNDHGEVTPEFNMNLAGRVFEEIVTYAMRGRYGSNCEVLSPLETFRFFSAVNGDKQAHISQDGLKFGIYGASFPDNLVLRNAKNSWVVQAVIESKSSSRSTGQNIAIQEQSYSNPFSLFRTKDTRESYGSKHLGRVLADVRPDLPAKPVAVSRKGYEVVFAVPRGSNLLAENSRRIVMPFFGHEFKQFLDTLLADCSK